MKKILIILVTVLFTSHSFSQKKIRYNSEKKQQIKKTILKKKKSITSFKAIKSSDHNNYVETLAVFYALSNKDQHKVVNLSLQSLVANKYLSKSDAQILTHLLNSKSLKRSYLVKLKNQKVIKNNLGSFLKHQIADDFYNNAPAGNGQDVPVSTYGWGKVAGGVTGAAIGAGIGFLAGANPATIIAGAILGAKLGSDIGEAAEQSSSDSSSSNNDSSVTPTTGDACVGYPFTPPNN